MDITTVISRYKSGKTLREIAEENQCTAECVRQNLVRHGLTAKDGGQAVMAKINRANKKAARDQKYMEKYGCDFDQYRSVVAHGAGESSPFRFYSAQKAHAKGRGVEWSLTFWEWWTIWDRSGKWPSRGRGKEKYCMCRKGDKGAYEVGNVYIGTALHNSTLGRVLAHERGTRKTLVYNLVRACGGRKAAALAAGVSPQYISLLACTDTIPQSWFRDGRIEALLEMSGHIHSKEIMARKREFEREVAA